MKASPLILKLIKKMKGVKLSWQGGKKNFYHNWNNSMRQIKLLLNQSKSLFIYKPEVNEVLSSEVSLKMGKNGK
jgi:hypothetical protein